MTKIRVAVGIRKEAPLSRFFTRIYQDHKHWHSFDTRVKLAW